MSELKLYLENNFQTKNIGIDDDVFIKMFAQIRHRPRIAVFFCDREGMAKLYEIALKIKLFDDEPSKYVLKDHEIRAINGYPVIKVEKI